MFTTALKGVDATIIPIIQIGKLRLRELRSHAQAARLGSGRAETPQLYSMAFSL